MGLHRQSRVSLLPKAIRDVAGWHRVVLGLLVVSGWWFAMACAVAAAANSLGPQQALVAEGQAASTTSLSKAEPAPARLTFSADPRKRVPVLLFGCTNLLDPPQRAMVYVRYSGSQPATGLRVVGLAPPFFVDGEPSPAPAGACGPSISADCTLTIGFDPRQAALTNGTPMFDRRRYMQTVQFEYHDGQAWQRSSNFYLMGTAPNLVRTVALTYNPIQFAPSVIGGSVSAGTTITPGDYGSIYNVRWVDRPQPPFFIAQDTCDPAKAYTHSPRESESCYLGVEFRPSQPGSFEQALRLSYDNGLAVQTATLRLEGAGYLPSASENVLVIYNEAIPESVDIKNEYLARRPGFAQVNVLGVSIPANGGGVPLEVMTKQDYQQRLLEPLAAWLRAHPQKRIGYIVLLYGIPTMRKWQEPGGWVFDGLQYALMTDVAALPGYVAPTNYASWTLRQALPLVTHLFMGTAPATKAYIAKLAAMAAAMPQPSLLISARKAGRAGSIYYLDDAAAPGYIGYTAATFGAGIRGEMSLKAPGAQIQYWPKTAPPLAEAADVAGYFGWGFNGGRGKHYATDGSLRFTGRSGWYIIQTAESFNGRLDAETFQGNYQQWFSRNAFGGTNYSNTPVGAVAHVVEPGLSGINHPGYFWSWENGQTFADCAWFSSQARTKIVVLGDPLVCR